LEKAKWYTGWRPAHLDWRKPSCVRCHYRCSIGLDSLLYGDGLFPHEGQFKLTMLLDFPLGLMSPHLPDTGCHSGRRRLAAHRRRRSYGLHGAKKLDDQVCDKGLP
jgi:hypothetical protein